MRNLILSLLASFCVVYGAGCTSALVNSSTKYVSLEPRRTTRSEVIKQLGTPRQSAPYNPAVAGSHFAEAPPTLRNERVSIYDEYRLSGLVFTPDYNPYAGFPEGYGIGMIVTLGLGELIYFPYYTADIAARGSRHYRLRLWYDVSGRLLAEENRPEQHAPAPNNALQRTEAGSTPSPSS